MARLNEPPAPAAESIDALKRRFIRQNREIARVNSTQSQRIRNLETEISRLLAENIAFREEAIRAREEAEKLRTSSRLVRDVLVLKQRLELKIGEVNSLVEELGDLPDRAARRSSIRRRKSGVAQNLIKSPDDREWRNRQTLSGILNPEQEGRLPAILEDKHYPRRTLEQAELRSLVPAMEDENIESPDIGPPPVVHFDVNEPIVFDSSKSPRRVSGGIVPKADDANALPTNLETRRKRRTSSLVHDLKSLENTIEASTDKVVEEITLPKTAPKRRIGASELENGQVTKSQEDFVFQRKSTSVADRARPSRFTARPARTSQTDANANLISPQKDSQRTRQALAPKTTNSPVKKKSVSLLDKKGLSKDDSGDDKKVKSTRGSALVKVQRPLHIDIPMDSIMDNGLGLQQPQTPGEALAELMSPPSKDTEPSTKSRSTPISEMAFTNSVEDVLNGSIGRGSRRARAAVSYAEPNLRDKMRRPDKKLVGAVEGLSKTAGSERDLSRSLNSEPVDLEKARDGVIDPGPHDLREQLPENMSEVQRWTSLPSESRKDDQKEEAASPLKDKELRQTLTTKGLERRHKRTFSESEGTKLESSIPRTSSDLHHDLETLSIFDPPSSSPIASKDEPTSRKSQSRSTNIAKSSAANGYADAAMKAATLSTGLKTRRHSIQIQSGNHPISAPMRSNSAMSIRGKDSTTTATAIKLKKANSVQTLAGYPTGVENEDPNSNSPVGRTIGTRRRSMMV